MGTDKYVAETVGESVRRHGARLRKLVELALHSTARSCGRNLAPLLHGPLSLFVVLSDKSLFIVPPLATRGTYVREPSALEY